MTLTIILATLLTVGIVFALVKRSKPTILTLEFPNMANNVTLKDTDTSVLASAIFKRGGVAVSGNGPLTWTASPDGIVTLTPSGTTCTVRPVVGVAGSVSLSVSDGNLTGSGSISVTVAEAIDNTPDSLEIDFGAVA
jgi:hypothetical protein